MKMVKKNHNHHDDNGDQSEKIRSLKGLNVNLLKQTAEKRHLLDSLKRSRDGLKEEVRWIGVAAKKLEEELSVASAAGVGMEVERIVMSCLMDRWRMEIREDVGRRLAEAREEVVRALSERVGGIRRPLDEERREVVWKRDVLVVERRELVDRVIRLTDKMEVVKGARTRLGESLKVAKRENEKLRRVKMESVRAVEGLVKEKEAVAEELALGREVGRLRGRVKELERVNGEIGREKKGKEDEIAEMEKELARLNEVVMSLEKEGGNPRSRFFELESLHDAALGKVKEMEREIGALVEENNVKEAEALRLKGVCDSLENKLRMVEEKLVGDEHSIEEMEKKRVEMEELVECTWKEISRLNREVAELKDEITGLELSCPVVIRKSRAKLRSRKLALTEKLWMGFEVRRMS